MKNVEWSETHGEGVICCTCDHCRDWEEYEFEDSDPDYREAQAFLRDLGWTSTQVNGNWKDFCCEDCRNQYIKENTQEGNMKERITQNYVLRFGETDVEFCKEISFVYNEEELANVISLLEARDDTLIQSLCELLKNQLDAPKEGTT